MAPTIDELWTDVEAAMHALRSGQNAQSAYNLSDAATALAIAYAELEEKPMSVMAADTIENVILQSLTNSGFVANEEDAAKVLHDLNFAGYVVLVASTYTPQAAPSLPASTPKG